MTSVFDDNGRNQVVTVIEVGPCPVVQVKTAETDGYDAVQLGFGSRKTKRTTKAMAGHFEAAGVDPAQHLVEFRGTDLDVAPGDIVNVADVFEQDDVVAVSGTSKGKGFQGVVKRHNFRGVGDATHGQHNRQRAPGSIGQASTPSRVFKGMKMAGRTGGERVTVKGLRVIRVLGDNHTLLVKGAVPGPKNGLLEIRKA